MKKFYLFVALLASWAAIEVSAQQQKVFVVNGDTLSEYDHVCLPHDGNSTITVKFVRDNLANQNAEFTYYWQSLGDLEKVSENNADSSATFRSTNLGKGAARLVYNNNGCGAVIDLHIYKEFNPNTLGLVIEGPDCLTKGEIAVYSVRPVLTRNLDAYIGVDNYYWNLTSETPPAFVDSIIYAAGDGSAVTFRVGDVSAGDEVVVNFGDCNRENAKSIRKPLGKLPPRPQVVDNLCVPCGQGNTRVISVLNPIEGVDYKCKAPSQWEVVAKSISVDAVSFTIKFDSISSDDLTITASFRDEESCGESVSNVHITRTWGVGAYMAYNNSATGACCAVVDGSSKYDFSVQGQIPTGALINWEIPAGWVEEDDNPYSRYRKIRPTAAVSLVDTIMAWSEMCDQTAGDTVWMPVYVKPAAISDITIDEVCLSPDTTYTFRAIQDTNAPRAASYTWQVKEGNNYVTKSDFTGDSLVLTVTTDMQAVRVRPNGLEGCNGEFSQDKELVFKPAAPTGIETDRCIATGMPDTTTLTLSGVIQNQSYNWILPSGVTYVMGNVNKTEIKVATAGIAGDYVVKAYGIGQGICGNTDTISETLHIAPVQFSLNFDDSGRRYIDVFTTPVVLEDVITDSPIVYYEWFMNDSLADEAVDAYETKVLKTFTGTIRLVVTQGNGCKQSATITIGQNARNNIKSRAFQDNTEHMTMVISPNPVKSLLNVIFPYDAERSIVRVYDMNGKLVFRQVTSEKQLDIATTNFPSGMYTLLLNQDGEPFSATFIVQH